MGRGRGQEEAHRERFEVFRHGVCPHQAIVDYVATIVVVDTHAAAPCALVEALVDVLGRESQLAEALAQRLSWFKHCGRGSASMSGPLGCGM